ncbi:hypothetical protein FACS1894164_12040 [Spirochaetia bacterium]|nr:hypothetical protein FACS1894164_12040 [Spirochaetia bacterium]
MDKRVLENTVLALLKAAPGLGSIHVNKGLLMIDAYYYSLFHRTLTGIQYVKDKYGPVPEPEARNIIKNMELDTIEVQKEEKGPHKKKSHVALVKPDYSVFPPEALAIINEVAERITSMSAQSLSEATHNKAWEYTEQGEIIPITSTYSLEVIDRSTRELTTSEQKEIHDILEEMYTGGTSGIQPVCAG